jgi:hypothetical protein
MRNTLVHASKKEPNVNAEALAKANAAWLESQSHAIPCGELVPPNYKPGMTTEQIWEHHRKQPLPTKKDTTT